MNWTKLFPWPVMTLLLAAAASVAPAAAPLEDPVARAALPPFKTIPAATPEELSPARTVPIGLFNLWPRSQGDNGSRRYSTLTQINKSNVKDLKDGVDVSLR
jgi:glucose dehydrogenase